MKSSLTRNLCVPDSSPIMIPRFNCAEEMDTKQKTETLETATGQCHESAGCPPTATGRAQCHTHHLGDSSLYNQGCLLAGTGGQGRPRARPPGEAGAQPRARWPELCGEDEQTPRDLHRVRGTHKNIHTYMDTQTPTPVSLDICPAADRKWQGSQEMPF